MEKSFFESISRAPRWLWALFLIALTSPFWSLSHALIEVDDARYAEVPREMVETGDWATPHLDYFDYVEKPPLPYWLTATSYKLFGVSEASARLALAATACAGIVLTAWLGWWLFSPITGLWAAVALSSSGLYFFLGHYITPDLPLTVFLLACSGLILRTLLRPKDARWAAPAAWMAAALAFLSKGLIAILFPVGWTVLLVLAVPKWRRPALRLLSPLGFAIFLAVAAPWFLLMEKRHPGFLHFFFVEQHFQRFLTHKYNRTNPWYFFLLLTPAVALPWTMPALAGCAWSLRNFRSRPEAASLAIWAAMIVAFFSTSQSKLITYILPVMPHLCLLCADALQNRLPRWANRGSMFLGGLFLTAAAAATIAAVLGWTTQLSLPAYSTASALLCVTALAALGAGLLAYAVGENAKALAAGGWILGAAALGVIRLNADAMSVKSLSADVKQEYRPGDQIYAYGIYLHGLPYYCGARVDKIVNWTGELHYAFRDPVFAPRHGDDRDIHALPMDGHSVFIVARSQDARQLLTLVDGEKIKENLLFGRWVLLKI